MAERRIAEIVTQAGSRHYIAYFIKPACPRLAGMPRHQAERDLLAHRPPDRRHLQAVRQPVVDKDAARKGEHLRLVLQPSER